MTGTQFVLIDAAAIFLLGIWTLFPYRSSRKTPVNASLLQPEHWAILSGGLPRAALTAFLQLLHQGLVVWNSEQRRYEPTDPQDQNPIVQLLHDRMPLPDIFKKLEAAHRPAERQLETWGLRWTSEAHEARIMKLVLPFVILLGAGVWRVILGIRRDQPFGFVLLLMGITLGLWFYAARTRPRNTLEGRNLLQKFTAEHDHILRATPRAELPLAVALMGETALAASEFANLSRVLPSKKVQASGHGPDGLLLSCGASDGGGDGGSGCGGCGGD